MKLPSVACLALLASTCCTGPEGGEPEYQFNYPVVESSVAMVGFIDRAECSVLPILRDFAHCSTPDQPSMGFRRVMTKERRAAINYMFNPDLRKIYIENSIEADSLCDHDCGSKIVRISSPSFRGTFCTDRLAPETQALISFLHDLMRWCYEPKECVWESRPDTPEPCGAPGDWPEI